MAHAMWTGTISFGLVSIPVKMRAATSRKGVSFNQLHNKCHTRIQEKRWCPECDMEVSWEEVEKGFEVAKDEYVSFSAEDFESLPLASKNVLEVESFVEIGEIDPIQFESSYYLEPDKKGQNSYSLLRTTLEKKKLVAVGKITLRTKERLCIVRVYESFLLVETLLYPDEIFDANESPIAKVTSSKQELTIAEHLVDLMTKPFDPSEYKDNYREALESLVEAKVSGKALKSKAAKQTGKVVDLMEALRQSVLSAQKDGSSKKSTAKPATKKSSTKTEAKAPSKIAAKGTSKTEAKTTAKAVGKKTATPINKKRTKAS